MNRTRLALCLFLIFAWLGVASPRGFAAQLVPLGPESDLYAGPFPNRPVLAAQPDGAYLIAWDEGGSPPFIYYRYVPAGGTPSEEEGPSAIDEELDLSPTVDAVTAVPKGFDVLVHEAYETPVTFWRHHLNLRGVPDARPVPLGGAGTQWVWQVRGNGLMAGWTLPRKHGIAVRRLTSSGQRTGPELRLNSRPIDAPRPVVLAVADGGFLAVWLGVVPGPTANLVLRARRFSPTGKVLGPDFDLNTTPLGVSNPDHYDPQFLAAAAPGGGFAIAWTLGDTIYLRYFDAADTARGPEIRAVQSKDLASLESMAFAPSGNLMLLRGQYVDDHADDTDLFLQLFDPRGASLAPAVGVRSEASDIFQSYPRGSVAWAGNSWLVTWAATAVTTGDFSDTFARRFALKK
jgi:hypothetical protein